MIQENVTLADKTSYKIGGVAQFYSAPSSLEELKEAVAKAKQKQLPLFILGKGSNVLVSDKGIEGLVIDMSYFNTISLQDTIVKAQAGAAFTKLIIQCINHELGGLEDLAGIPGTVGGAILMNAGAYEQTVSETITSVTWLDISTGKVTTSPHEKLSFGYRTSTFRNKETIILEVTFTLHPQKKVILKKRVQEIQNLRRSKQPLQYPSCGSVFKRPLNNYAGVLIEQAGLKGYTLGGAQISEKHANFIINTGNATSEDIHQLISLIRKEVFNKSSILLENEVIFIGEFDTPLWEPPKKDV